MAKLDGRTKEARLIRETRERLVAHCGGQPSAIQQALVEQICVLALRLATMDRKFPEAGTFDDHDVKTCLAWSNSYTRLLRQFGLKGEKEHAAGLHDVSDVCEAAA